MKIDGYFSKMFSTKFDISEEDAEPLREKIVIHFNGISESLYQYLKSYYTYVDLDGYENLFLGTITPINLYGNVENGLGIFGACACFESDTIYYNLER